MLRRKKSKSGTTRWATSQRSDVPFLVAESLRTIDPCITGWVLVPLRNRPSAQKPSWRNKSRLSRRLSPRRCVCVCGWVGVHVLGCVVGVSFCGTGLTFLSRLVLTGSGVGVFQQVCQVHA